MPNHPPTEFSGVAGRVLQRSVSIGSLVTGILVASSLIGGNWILLEAGAVNAATIFNQIVIAFALARFALNGHRGEWGGTVLSTSGGPWSQVAIVALRYLSLTAVWLLPLVVFGLRLEHGADLGPVLAFGATQLMIFVALYFLLTTLTPPLFLIVSIAAEDFGDVFSPGHWRRQFAGRLGDLLVVYVVYTGAIAMVLILSIPPAMMASGGNAWLGRLVGALSLCLMLGISINLLGRLCGFFACGEPDAAPAVEPPTALPESEPQTLAEEAPPPPDSLPVSEPVEPLPAAAPAPPIETSAEAGPVDRDLPARERTVDAPELTTAPEVSLRLDATPEAIAEHMRKTPLLDAQQRVESAMKRFRLDPSYTLSALSEMHNNFAPSPHVMQALTICLHRTGHLDAALAIGSQALKICFEQGHAFLAAGIVKEMRSRIERLQLGQEQILTIAAALVKKGDLAVAAQAYSMVVGSDPTEVRAVKGLLGVADQILRHRRKPDAAIKVYGFLLEHCASSPFAELIHAGLEEARRKSERRVAAGSTTDE